jgi:hypothetical protein
VPHTTGLLMAVLAGSSCARRNHVHDRVNQPDTILADQVSDQLHVLQCSCHSVRPLSDRVDRVPVLLVLEPRIESGPGSSSVLPRSCSAHNCQDILTHRSSFMTATMAAQLMPNLS